MKPVRSLLFIPANNREWVEEGPFKYEADGYIFDLEDAVPPGEKQGAREILREAYALFEDTDAVITARVNAPDTGLFEPDLAEIVHPRLDAILIPKVPSPMVIHRAEHVLDYLETVRDIDRRVEIIALPETAEGMYRAYEVCAASDRVAAIAAGTSRGADIERALGWEWTREGDEKQYMRAKILMEARAAGLDQILSGAWVDVEDIEGLRMEAQRARELGYTGYQVIHPTHIEPVNEIFTPDAEDVEYFQRLLTELETAEVEEGRGAVRFEGEMIDIAHIKTAEQLLARARAFGLVDEK